MTRIFVAAALAAGSEIELPDAAARHVAQVLRMRAGEHIVIFNGTGGEFGAEIVLAERRNVRVRLSQLVEVDRESPLEVSLAQCVSKGERMDYTLQKAVELGVSRVLPLLSERSVVRIDAERWDRKLEHWRGVIHSASEQSGRTRVPEVRAVERLDAWLPASGPGLKLVLAPAGGGGLRSLPVASELTLLVGPEGGLSEREIALAVRAGFTSMRLGPRVLRTETAGVAALAALQALHGDLG